MLCNSEYHLNRNRKISQKYFAIFGSKYPVAGYNWSAKADLVRSRGAVSTAVNLRMSNYLHLPKSLYPISVIPYFLSALGALSLSHNFSQKHQFFFLPPIRSSLPDATFNSSQRLNFPTFQRPPALFLGGSNVISTPTRGSPVLPAPRYGFEFICFQGNFYFPQSGVFFTRDFAKQIPTSSIFLPPQFPGCLSVDVPD